MPNDLHSKGPRGSASFKDQTRGYDIRQFDLEQFSNLRQNKRLWGLADQRRDAAEKEAASRRATDALVLADAERLIAAWNEREAKQMPMIFSPTIGQPVSVSLSKKLSDTAKPPVMDQTDGALPFPIRCKRVSNRDIGGTGPTKQA